MSALREGGLGACAVWSSLDLLCTDSVCPPARSLRLVCFPITIFLLILPELVGGFAQPAP